MKNSLIAIYWLCIFLLSYSSLFGQLTKASRKVSPQTNPTNTNSRKQSFTIRNLYAIPPKPTPTTFGQRYIYSSIPQEKIPASEPVIVYAPEYNTPIQIKGKLKNPNFILGRNGTPVEERSFAYIDAVKSILGIKRPLEEFSIQKVQTGQNGRTHVRVQQYYKGLKVYGGELIVHEINQTVVSMNGRPFPTPQIATILPAVDEKSALNLAKSDLKRIHKFTDFNESYSAHAKETLELIIFHPQGNPETPKLSWKVSLTPNLSNHWHYFIDAQSGEILLKYDEICNFFHPIVLEEHFGFKHTKPSLFNKKDTYFNLPPDIGMGIDLGNNLRNLNIYEDQGVFFLLDVSKPMFNAGRSNLPSDPVGAIWTIDASNTSPINDDFQASQVFSTNKNNWEDPSAVSAHHNANLAYQYFAQTFQRNSINGRGGNIVSFINVADEDNEDMDNAFWNGVAMFYGNGDVAFSSPLARSLDVAGHEIAHGVIQAEANLEYIGQSGALNESFADVFGVLIDRDDWQLGEEVVNRNIFRSGALRDMQNPNNGGSRFGQTGWQPAHLDEFVELPFTEEGDNGGVHVNSGIPNRAFFLIASSIGREAAERIYYNALQNYLVRSSQFIDMRIAALEAAAEDFGQSEINAVAAAFDAVGIFGNEGTDTQVVLDENAGDEFILFTDSIQSVLKVARPNGEIIANPLTRIGPSNKPSITDDGSTIVYIDQDNHIQAIFLDPQTSQLTDQFILSEEPVWRNVAISKDGRRIAAITTDRDNLIYVFDFTSDPVRSQIFELDNPTTAAGVETGDVQFADVLEWDALGAFLMYDANNVIETFDGAIEYWDIGFIRVWDVETNNFGDGFISKLFSGLPENTSVGNPTFAKNAPFVVAFDFVEEDRSLLRTANTETGEIVTILNNSRLNYPNYSVDDRRLIFDASISNGEPVVGVAQLQEDRINLQPNTDLVSIIRDNVGARWGVWYANGQRILTSDEVISAFDSQLQVFPNPFGEQLNLDWEDQSSPEYQVRLSNLAGQVVLTQVITTQAKSINTSQLAPGAYILTVRENSGQQQSFKVIKVK